MRDFVKSVGDEAPAQSNNSAKTPSARGRNLLQQVTHKGLGKSKLPPSKRIQHRVESAYDDDPMLGF